MSFKRLKDSLSKFRHHHTTGTYRSDQGLPNNGGLPPYSAVAGPSSSDNQDSDFAFLGDFDTIFLVDDSDSMSAEIRDGGKRRTRWDDARDAIATIAPICTQYDEDGIDIYFLNHRNNSSQSRNGEYTNITTAKGVSDIFDRVEPWGATPVGKRLGHILRPYLQRVEAMHASEKARGEVDPDLFVKPINIITITDGKFTDDAEEIICQTAEDLKLHRALPWQVGIQFFQIGDDRRATEFLQELDNDLQKKRGVRDIVDTIPYNRKIQLKYMGILKVVLGAVKKKLDQQEV